jgi:maleate isomerase
VRLGMIVPPDYANDREAWRWCPANVTLLATRTGVDPAWQRAVARQASEPESTVIPSYLALRRAVRSLVPAGPDLITYACASCSFLGPRDREYLTRRAMVDAGAPLAQTTSTALLDALDALRVRCVSVATPYSEATTAALASFLSGRDFHIGGLAYVPPKAGRNDAELTREEVVDLIARADHPSADAIVLSCTELATFDVISLLEAALGKPLVTATQATRWAALGALGAVPIGSEQALLDHSWQPSPRRKP